MKRSYAAVLAVTLALGTATLAGAATASVAGGGTSQASDSDSYSRAGFSTAHRHVSSVGATWTQPELDCAATPTGRLRIEVALERPGYRDAVMIGTDAKCVGGTARYFGWFKEPARAYEKMPGTLKPGDHVDALVWVNVAAGQANGSIHWQGGGASVSGLSGFHGFQRLTGAVLVRTLPHQGSSNHYPLASFGTVYFYASQGDHEPIGSGATVNWRMVGHTGSVRAVTSGLHDDGSFAVNWRAAR